MGTAKVAYLRQRGDALQITRSEWQAFEDAKLADALTFYIQLRAALTLQYVDCIPFSLPATKLAEDEFLPGRRDRKLYLRLTMELMRLGVIEKVRPAGFAPGGRRAAALFMFTKRHASGAQAAVGKIIFLDHRKAMA